MTARTVYESMLVGLPVELASDIFIIATAKQVSVEEVVEEFLWQSIKQWIMDHPVAGIK